MFYFHQHPVWFLLRRTLEEPKWIFEPSLFPLHFHTTRTIRNERLSTSQRIQTIQKVQHLYFYPGRKLSHFRRIQSLPRMRRGVLFGRDQKMPKIPSRQTPSLSNVFFSYRMLSLFRRILSELRKSVPRSQKSPSLSKIQ